jgi:hypothetical protein
MWDEGLGRIGQRKMLSETLEGEIREREEKAEAQGKEAGDLQQDKDSVRMREAVQYSGWEQARAEGRGRHTSRLRVGQWTGTGVCNRHDQDRPYANNE